MTSYQATHILLLLAAMSKNTKNLTSFPLCGLLPLLADSCSLFVRIFGAQPYSIKESIIELIQYVIINVNKYTMECHKIHLEKLGKIQGHGSKKHIPMVQLPCNFPAPLDI